MDKIKDVVPPGVHSGDQVRPRYRTLWRNAGGEQAKRSLRSQSGEVWHPPFVHELLQELRIHAVDAEDDQLLFSMPITARTLARGQLGSGTKKQQASKYPDNFLQRLTPFTVVTLCRNNTPSRKHACSRVAVQFDGHPEQAFFAQRRIWASRAKGRALCDPTIARLARFPAKLHHYRQPRRTFPATSQGIRLYSMSRRHFSWFLLGVLISALLPGRCSASSGPNIILVTLGSTRADRMGFLDSRRRLTPNLDALAKQSIIFERAYSQGPLTVVSHATILSGTYPQTHHASELGAPLATGLPYLPDLLHARGYRTAAFVGSILLDPRNGFAPGFDRGFDVYDAGFRPIQPGENRPLVERPADQVVARVTKWLRQNAQHPFFLWVHLCEPHASSSSSYDSGVAATDLALGKLVAALQHWGLDAASMIVVVADHGESLGAHGEDTHGIFLYDETIHVPLLVKLPQNTMAGKRVKGRVRLLDIAPTVLEAARIPIPSQMQGQSLLRIAKANADADQPAYARSDFPQQAFGWSVLESWRAGKYLYIRAPQPELYDLSADPNATRNLTQSSPATLQTIAAQLKAFDDHFGNEAGKSVEAGLTASEMQKLASSGVDAAVAGTDPKNTIAIANQTLKAMLTLDEGKPEKAIPAFRQVLAGQTNTYLAQYGLGVALAQQQQYSEAIEHLHKAIELQPDSTWAHYLMGFSLFKIGDFKTSAIHLEIASGRLPQFGGLHAVLAQVYERLGRTQDATREHTKASQLGRD